MADRVSPLPLPWPPQGHFIRRLAPSASGASPSVFIALLVWGLPTPPTTCFCAHALGLLPQQLFQAVLKAALRDGGASEQPVARLLPAEPDHTGAASGSPISEYCVTCRGQRTGAWPDGSPSDLPARRVTSPSPQCLFVCFQILTHSGRQKPCVRCCCSKLCWDLESGSQRPSHR